ncbi:MAG: endonuclease [Bacteroidetes bacterium]|nr:endonuclease [Bacteroidota bacterium]
MKFVITTLVSVCAVFQLSYSQIPPGYYNDASGLYGQSLELALHNIIDNQTVVSYSSIWNYFQQTDKKPDNKVWDPYSDVPGGTPPYEFTFITDQCGGYTQEGDCYNREHSWPVSWFGDIAPMNTDLFHIYPTDGYVNNKRSNFPLGEVTNATWTSQNGSKLGNCSFPGYTGTVFEPLDSFKGDFARTYFYMSVRYYTQDAGWPGSDMTNGSQLEPWAQTMMLQWNTQDPVSQKETDRNDAVFLIQGNRNPFIDNPQWAVDIWGPGAGIKEQENAAEKLIVYPNPAHASCQVSFPANYTNIPCRIFVRTLTGIRVFSEDKLDSNALIINLNTLPAGVYFITSESNGHSLPLTGKLILQ